MGYSECCVRIEKFNNGFTVEIKDPAIQKANDKRDFSSTKGPSTPYREPWRTFVFKTDKEVIAFLNKNLKKAITQPTADDFGTNFDMAVESDDG